jgi:hypothetical protein
MSARIVHFLPGALTGKGEAEELDGRQRHASAHDLIAATGLSIHRKSSAARPPVTLRHADTRLYPAIK